MFAAFPCTGPAETQFSRTACDICRAKNLKCRGTGDSCDECIASSNACTYTFSSGIGPGKKRRRKVWSPTFNATMSQHRPSPRPKSLSREPEGRPRSRNSRSEQWGNEWNNLLDIPDGAVVTPAELVRHGTQTNNSHSTRRASDQDWSDVCLSGDGLGLCPSKQMSPFTRSTPQLQSSIEPTLGANCTPSLDQDMLQIFDEPSLQSGYNPPPTPTTRRNSFSQNVLQPGILEFTPQSLPTSPPSNSAVIRKEDTNAAQDKASEMSPELPRRCDCVASLSQRLKELDLQESFDTKSAPTDTIFLSFEKGIDHFSEIFLCDRCSINDVNPILIITTVNQLALMLSEIVHRLTHCRSPDSVPVVFQFGRYSVQKTKMRTSLLTGMIDLHVHCLNQLITQLEKHMAGQPRTLLAGATSIVASMQQTLGTFLGGSHIRYDN